MRDLCREYQLAWAAGFFDGEGCISIRRGKLAQIKWSQKDKAALIQLDVIFGTGHINTSHNILNGMKFEISNYCVYGREAIAVLREMLPYLVVKRQKALQAIATESAIHPYKLKITQVPRRCRLQKDVSLFL